MGRPKHRAVALSVLLSTPAGIAFISSGPAWSTGGRASCPRVWSRRTTTSSWTRSITRSSNVKAPQAINGEITGGGSPVPRDGDGHAPLNGDGERHTLDGGVAVGEVQSAEVGERLWEDEPAGDEVCFEGGCPSDVEPPHGSDPHEVEIPALREIKSSSAGPTVWSEFSALAAETGAPVNLGQGFPNWNPPDFVVNAAHKALSEGFHQYTRTAGHPRLVQLLAKRYSKHFGREVDPFSQVAITIGASQALYVSFQAILSPGDEVVLLEPFFDLYLGQIRMAGGVPRPVPLSVVDGEWRLDAGAIRSVISPRTRAIVVNTPHNPTGKVFSRQELEDIADVVRENSRILVISDEVYKYMVYEGLGAGGGAEDRNNGVDSEAAAAALPASRSTTVSTTNGSGGGSDGGGRSSSRDSLAGIVLQPESEGGSSAAREAPPAEVVKMAENGVGVPAAEPLPALRHVHFATLPGMWDRTITISSAGKTFSVTGWQVGWVLGPRRVIQEIHTILPYMQFCAATPLQEAMCTVLVDAEKPYEGSRSYYDWLRDQYAGKRRRLEEALAAARIRSLKGEGGFFLIGDVGKIKVPEKYLKESTPAMPKMTHDWAFCRWMAIEHGLVAIPTSPFFSEMSRARGLGNGLVRFCFCKTEETIEAAAEVLGKMAREQAEIESRVAVEPVVAAARAAAATVQ